ncbi:MAG: CdaR family protein [Atribacterota bacterium]|nr:CdaR family protein [Atribacterota bacterium]MDD5497022.1 CdaR family protein [Atribacterota bacterium]
MNRLKNLLLNNFDIKILALVMAIILWFYVSSEYRSFVERYYEIEVEPINLNDNLSIKEIREKVSVGIKGPQNIIENITPSKITGTVDLQNIKEAGDYLIEVKVIAPRNTEIIKIIPEEVRVIVEEIVSHEYSVEYNLIGLPEKGYSLTDEPEIVPKEVLVIAPTSIHEMIAQVRVDIDISSINKDLDKEEKVIVYGKDNTVLNNLEVRPETVLVSIQVREGYPEKVLPIKPRIIGKPAPGFYVSKIEANPSSIKVYGDYLKIVNLDFLETIPIDVNGISKTLTVKVPPIIEEGIIFAEDQETLIEVQIQVAERDEEKIFQNIKIEPREASPFIEIQLIPDTVDIKVMGKYNNMVNLKIENIKVFVNLSDMGQETAKVEVELPPGVELVQVIPEVVTISVKR